MKNKKTTIKQALTMFNISRTSLYNHMKKLDIKPIKEGGRVHLVDTQINDLKEFLQPACQPLDNENEQRGQAGQHEQANNNEEIYQEQIKELKKELKKERTENKKLIQDVGRWEGVARTLQDQNQKLLELKPEDKSEIEEAEIIEPEPEPEKKAEKIGIFRKIINYRF